MAYTSAELEILMNRIERANAKDNLLNVMAQRGEIAGDIETASLETAMRRPIVDEQVEPTAINLYNQFYGTPQFESRKLGSDIQRTLDEFMGRGRQLLPAETFAREIPPQPADITITPGAVTPTQIGRERPTIGPTDIRPTIGPTKELIRSELGTEEEKSLLNAAYTGLLSGVQTSVQRTQSINDLLKRYTGLSFLPADKMTPEERVKLLQELSRGTSLLPEDIETQVAQRGERPTSTILRKIEEIKPPAPVGIPAKTVAGITSLGTDLPQLIVLSKLFGTTIGLGLATALGLNTEELSNLKLLEQFGHGAAFGAAAGGIGRLGGGQIASRLAGGTLFGGVTALEGAPFEDIVASFGTGAFFSGPRGRVELGSALRDFSAGRKIEAGEGRRDILRREEVVEGLPVRDAYAEFIIGTKVKGVQENVQKLEKFFGEANNIVEKFGKDMSPEEAKSFYRQLGETVQPHFVEKVPEAREKEVADAEKIREDQRQADKERLEREIREEKGREDIQRDKEARDKARIEELRKEKAIVSEKEAKAAAEKHGLIYDGLQERVDKPPAMTFTDKETKSTFNVEKVSEIPSKLAEVREKFVEKPVEKEIKIITDADEIQKMKNSIAEGTLILKSGLKSTGEPHSKESLLNIRKHIIESKKKIGDTSATPEIKIITPRKPKVVGAPKEIAKLPAKSTIEKMIDKVPTEPEKIPIVPKVPKKAETAIERFDKMESEAMARIAERSKGTTLGAAPFHELPNSADYIIIGAAKIGKGAVKFKQWSKEMVETLGEEVRPYLKAIYKDAKKRAKGLKHLNIERLNVTHGQEKTLLDAIEKATPQLEKVKGETLSHQEVINEAKKADMLKGVITRDESLEMEAEILKSRQNLVELAKDEKSTRKLLENLQTVSSIGTHAGRLLESHKIPADASNAGLKIEVAKRLLKLGHSVDELAEEFAKINWNDAKEVTKFYRKYEPATFSEWIDEYRYINMLSSPKTHALNTLSNLIQVTGLRPATRLASGAIDRVASTFNTQREREFYIRQVPAYYRGVLNSVGRATTGAIDALSGKTKIERPDIARIPTGSKWLKWGETIPRALEAGDVFFRTMAQSGEIEALAMRNRLKGGKKLTEAEIEEQARGTAEAIVFRKPPDPKDITGQGNILSNIDRLTGVIYSLRKVPSVKWFTPFVRTPMNIVKQGIEYSPLGWGTLWKSKNKVEQAGKALIGSMVFAAAGQLALDDKLTWAVPRSKKVRELFYSAGMQPYSVKVGDKWVSYSRIGPMAYPLAMSAAIKYYWSDDPKSDVSTAGEKTILSLAGIAKFFSDQSYLQGISNILRAIEGGERGIADVALTAPKQLIPLASLQRWVSHLVDPIYRKGKPSLSPKGIVENIQKDLPWLSKGVPPYIDANTGKPSTRDLPGYNAFSPFTIKQEKEEFVDYFKEYRLKQRERAFKNFKDDAKDEIIQLMISDRNRAANKLLVNWNLRYPNNRMVIRNKDIEKAKKKRGNKR